MNRTRRRGVEEEEEEEEEQTCAFKTRTTRSKEPPTKS